MSARTWGHEEDRLLPQIDHLTAAQLRRRAADDRADAKLLDPQKCPGAIRMLLENAERCEALVDRWKAAMQLPAVGLAGNRARTEGELRLRGFNWNSFIKAPVANEHAAIVHRQSANDVA